MKSRHEQRIKRVRRKREIVCAALLLVLLAVWLAVAMLAGRSAPAASAGSTWGRTVAKLYHDAGRRLDEVAGERGEARRVIVFPLAGRPARTHDFANLGPRAFISHVRARLASGQLPRLQGARLVEGSRPPGAGDLAVEFFIDDLQPEAGDNPESFKATMGARLVGPGGERSDLLPARDYTGSNQTLAWFVKERIAWWARGALLLLSLALVAVGFYFAVIYYRLVGGVLRCPPWLAGPVNDLRASSGLIASSLVLLSGFVLLTLVFLLAPRTGDALDERRTHVDIIVDGDELTLPPVQRGVVTNPLAGFVEDVVSDVVGGLTASRGAASAGASLESQPFPEWMRYSLPSILRSPATEIRVSHGSSWRVFAASEGEAHAAGPELLWPGLERDRRAAIRRSFDSIRSRMPERGLGLPLPWNTNQIPGLDPVTLAALRGSGEAGDGRLVRLVVSSFQSPSPGYLAYWLTESTNRPADERVYAILMPGLPRSASRAWEALEGRLLTARAVADRVASAQRVPENLAPDDPRLKAFAVANVTNAVPDFTSPVVDWDGVGVRAIGNYGVARDFNVEAATVFAGMSADKGASRAIVDDFRRWLWGGQVELERIEVFTIPRAAMLWLIGVLGLTFALAGVRSEASAQGIRWWLPPVIVVFSAVVLPLIAGGWLHSRGDTTRYVVFGFADLAFWGVLFLWYCVAVLPFFDGRARVGFRRDRWMTSWMCVSVALAATAPLWPAGPRLVVAQASLVACALAAAAALAATWFARGSSGSLRLTLVIVLLVALGYWRVWGWEGQDVPAIFLLVLLLTTTVSGWSRGLNWWRISAKADYDRIPWLKPSNRLLLALVLTMTGAAVVYCSFPAAAAGGLIRGYISYSVVFCVMPFLLCSAVLILVDLLEREAL